MTIVIQPTCDQKLPPDALTLIHSNGSKWLGEAPDSIDDLIAVMGEYALDRKFEIYGNFCESLDRESFIHKYPGGAGVGWVAFSGNFHGLSHAFRIDTRDPALVDRLRKAIRANKRREDYRSQPKPVRLHRRR